MTGRIPSPSDVTTVLSSSLVNALHVAINKGNVNNYQTPFFRQRTSAPTSTATTLGTW
jgi:hypothetical protein